MSSRAIRHILLSCFLLTLILAAGCGSKEVAPLSTDAVKSELLKKTWYCNSILKREVHEDSKPTLQFLADGTVKGNGGCNDFSGQYTLDGQKILFGPFMSTKKACGPATDEQEFTYLSILAQAMTLQVEDDELQLFLDNNPDPMIFSTDEGGGLLW